MIFFFFLKQNINEKQNHFNCLALLFEHFIQISKKCSKICITDEKLVCEVKKNIQQVRVVEPIESITDSDDAIQKESTWEMTIASKFWKVLSFLFVLFSFKFNGLIFLCDYKNSLSLMSPVVIIIFSDISFSFSFFPFFTFFSKKRLTFFFAWLIIK